MTRTDSPSLAWARRTTFKSDGGDGGVGSLFVSDVVRDGGAEVASDGGDAAVRGGGGNAIAGLEFLDAGSAFEHNAGGGITERHGVVQFGRNLGERGADAFGAHLLQDAFNVLRALAGFPERLLRARSTT